MSIARILRAALLAIAVGSLSFAVPAAAQPIPGTDLEAAELVAGLPWAFELAVEAPSGATDGAGAVAAVTGTRYRFKSTEQRPGQGAPRVVACRCGSGCREVAAEPEAPPP